MYCFFVSQRKPRSDSGDSLASSIFSKITSPISSRLLNSSQYSVGPVVEPPGLDSKSISPSMIYGLHTFGSKESPSRNTAQLGIIEVYLFETSSATIVLHKKTFQIFIFDVPVFILTFCVFSVRGEGGIGRN